jgi:pyruvate formate lyase activating enzyme
MPVHEAQPATRHHPGRWWSLLEDGRVQCDLCPRACKMREGQRGFCFVRMNEASRVVLTTYGRSSGFCVDPIEKKPLFHFYPGSSVLSFGTAGCNLGCRFCQNWNISKARQADLLTDVATPEAIARQARALGCRSVAFTYNDPVIFAEYALDVAAACRREGIKTVAVTAGYISPGARAEFFDAMDAANVDLKAFTEDFYKNQCFGQLAPVLETLLYIRKSTRTWLELTTLLIPGLNDGDDEVDALSRWVAENLGPETPLHLTAFHPDYRLRDLPPTPPATVERARERALAAGLHFVYVGNVASPHGADTWCPNCGGLLVERHWRAVARQAIANGACTHCGRPIPGHFDAGPATG